MNPFTDKRSKLPIASQGGFQTKCHSQHDTVCPNVVCCRLLLRGERRASPGASSAQSCSHLSHPASEFHPAPLVRASYLPVTSSVVLTELLEIAIFNIHRLLTESQERMYSRSTSESQRAVRPSPRSNGPPPFRARHVDSGIGNLCTRLWPRNSARSGMTSARLAPRLFERAISE